MARRTQNYRRRFLFPPMRSDSTILPHGRPPDESQSTSNCRYLSRNRFGGPDVYTSLSDSEGKCPCYLTHFLIQYEKSSMHQQVQTRTVAIDRFIKRRQCFFPHPIILGQISCLVFFSLLRSFPVSGACKQSGNLTIAQAWLDKTEATARSSAGHIITVPIYLYQTE